MVRSAVRAPDTRTARYLGAAFLAQFATSLVAGILSASILAGTISAVLVNISENVAQMRASIVLQLFTSVGIIVLASLFYVVLRDQNRTLALVALALWLTEAVMLAVSTLGVYALLSLSVDYVKAGTPASDYQNVGSAFLGLYQHASDVDMLFFCLGAILWYYLLFRSRIVPRAISTWGLLAVFPVLLGTLLLVWDRSFGPSAALYVPYVPFEFVISLWLLVKGASPASLAGVFD